VHQSRVVVPRAQMSEYQPMKRWRSMVRDERADLIVRKMIFRDAHLGLSRIAAQPEAVDVVIGLEIQKVEIPRKHFDVGPI
jgi:hypothetical protein